MAAMSRVEKTCNYPILPRFFFPCLSFIQISVTNYKILHIIVTCEKIQVSLCKTTYVFYCVFMAVYVMAQS